MGGEACECLQGMSRSEGCGAGCGDVGGGESLVGSAWGVFLSASARDGRARVVYSFYTGGEKAGVGRCGAKRDKRGVLFTRGWTGADPASARCVTDYDDPAIEEQWCQERRAQVEAYLQHQRVEHGRVGEWPAWHVAPHVSLWAIESKVRPDWVGWWAICGDLPTDYVSAANIKHPREAVRASPRDGGSRRA